MQYLGDEAGSEPKTAGDLTVMGRRLQTLILPDTDVSDTLKRLCTRHLQARFESICRRRLTAHGDKVYCGRPSPWATGCGAETRPGASWQRRASLQRLVSPAVWSGE